MRIPKWLRCVLWAFLLGAAALALSIGGFYTVVRWRGDHAWREYAAQSAARGETLDVLPAPSTLPSERNFMKTPVLDRWMFGENDDPAFEQFLKDLRATGISGLYFDSGDSVGWLDGGHVDFAKTANAWFKCPRDGKAAAVAPEETPVKRFLALLAPMNSLFDELRRASVARMDSELVRPTTINHEEPLKSPIARFRLARVFSHALTAHGSAALADGKSAEAFGDALAALRFSRGLTGMRDPFLVESMVGIMMTKTALQPVWEGCQRHAWSDPQLMQLQNELSAIHPVETLQRGLRTDRASMVLAFDNLPSRAGGGQVQFLSLCPRGWIQQIKVICCTCCQQDLEVLNAAGTPGFLKRRAEGTAMKETLFRSANLWSAPSTYLAALGIPYTEKVLISSARVEAFVTLARTACALERHRLAHGAYPEALDALVPDYLSTVSRDVIDGQPLRFRRLTDDSFKLWSIGIDGRDDNGTPVKSNQVDELGGDWVWLQSAVSGIVGN